MIKITKINGLQLQEPPNDAYVPNNFIKNQREINTTSFRREEDNYIKQNTHFQRHSENNSIEYNNINTSFTDNQNNFVGNTKTNFTENVNRSYNFKNLNEKSNIMMRNEEIVIRNSIEKDRIEKNLEITNDKLKSNNSAKTNIINKMEFSFRDVSKFLKQ